MLALAIVFGLLSMVGFSLANVTSQPLSQRLGSSQMLFLRGISISILLGLIAVPKLLQQTNLKYVSLTLLLGALGYLPVLAFTLGVRASRVAIVVPIAGCSSLITVLVSCLFIGTTVHTLQWLAIALIVAGNIITSLNFKSLRESNLVTLASGVPYALAAAFGWGLFYFALIYPSKTIGPWATAFLTELGVTLAAGLHCIVGRTTIDSKQIYQPTVLLSAVSLAVGTAAYTFGVAHYNVSIVAALSTSMALLSAVLAIFFYKEKVTRSELIAAVAMVGGVVLLTIS